MSAHNKGVRCTEAMGCGCSDCCLCYACLFHRRSASLYSGLRSRLKERKWKNGPKAGQVRVAKRDLPFTLEQFRGWLTVVLEDTPRCEYCGDPISIAIISPDHAVPMQRGGSLGIPNLRPCCQPCNTAKGQLLPGEFIVLRKLLMTFTEPGRVDVFKRLRGGIRHFGRKPKAQETPATVAPQILPAGSTIAFPAALTTQPTKARA